MRNLWEEHGEVWIKSRKAGSGRKRKIVGEQEEMLKKYLDANPNAYIKEMTIYLREKCDLVVDETTVWRTIQKRGWLNGRPKLPRLRDDHGLWVKTIPRDEEGQATRSLSEESHTRVRSKTPCPKKPKGEKKKRRTGADKLLERTRVFLKQHMSDPRYDCSHDYGHAERVAKLAMHILKSEQAAHPNTLYDPLLLEMAALLHDVEDHKYMREPAQDRQMNGYTALINGAQYVSPYSYPFNQQHQAYRAVPPHAPLPSEHNQALENHSTDDNPSLFNQPASSSTQPQTRPSFPWPANMPPPSAKLPAPQPKAKPKPSPQDHPVDPQTPTPPTPPSSSKPTESPQTMVLRQHIQFLSPLPSLTHILCTIIPQISYSYSRDHPEQVASTISQHPELAILQDADRLDALGGIGVARAFSFGGAKGRGMEDTLKHFDEKLAKLEDGMWTKEGKRIAREKAKRLRIFKGWWDEEAEGRDYADEAHTDQGEMVADPDAKMEVEYGAGFVDGAQRAPDPVLDPRINRINGIIGGNTGSQTDLERWEMGPGEQLVGEMLRVR